MSEPAPNFTSYQLSDRYSQTKGRVFLTGTQALVRIMLDQARRDRAAGLNTAGFVSGYRGSPLGGLDLELWNQCGLLDENRIKFLPAVNEDLGATAVLGAQQVPLDPQAGAEGVFSMWYGKGPGVDRSGDALKHGNAYGSSKKGGVLVVAGDDHGCVSSSMPHQSDAAFLAWFMPVLNPASIDEYLSYGEYGIALSRFSGTWVGFKAISETVESARSITLPADRKFTLPDIDLPAGGLHIRRGDGPSPDIEIRLKHKLRAVEAFVQANPIDHAIYDLPDAKYGFVSTGKGHLDLLESLRLLGLDEPRCRALGIDIYKVGMVWPLARRDALAFVKGKAEVMVIEEKRGIIESQFKEYFYDWPGSKPARMVGKTDETASRELVPWTGELSPRQLAPLIAQRLHAIFPDENLPARAAALAGDPPILNVTGATRTPYFCSGCPHNTSTRLPQGSSAAAGIGCHVMASWMDRDTDGFAQMGGEGVPWAASSLFNGKKHIFQNLGEGTWYHSGALAIRQAVAAQANITYKILYNDAVAMTGGQPVDGPVSVAAIAQSSRAEGVSRIALVSDDIAKFKRADFPAGTTFHDRSELDGVQRELRAITGVSVLIYEQTCATEKRRRRKRGTLDTPDAFAVINPLVCEGCGDCSTASNCLSVEPLETEFGRKRQINQSSCNKDFSCLNGFCPSFVTVTGGERRKSGGADIDLAPLLATLPAPDLPDLAKPFDLLVTGVGGTGVVTVGALITMAAHIEGRGSSVLDFTGFAQKFGTVLSYIRLADAPDSLNQVRIDRGAADAVIGCDVVVSSAPKASAHYHHGTRMVLNTAAMPTGDLVLNRDADLRIDTRVGAIAAAIGAGNLSPLDANALAEKLLGDSVFANVMMLGFAWQKGLIPVSDAALKQAILLNGVAIPANTRAFDMGRIMAHSPDALTTPAPVTAPQTLAGQQTLADLIAHRADFLTGYQNAAYATRYRNRMSQLAHLPDAMQVTAAKSLFRLMAYKDEYEVARLHHDPAFTASLNQQFQGDFKIHHHLAPPMLPSGKDAQGRPNKRRFGPWMRPVLRQLARLKPLRGTWFDPFARTADRRLDRALLVWFDTILDHVAAGFSDETAQTCASLLALPQGIRGYGPVREQAAEKAQKQSLTLLAQLG